MSGNYDIHTMMRLFFRPQRLFFFPFSFFSSLLSSATFVQRWNRNRKRNQVDEEKKLNKKENGRSAVAGGRCGTEDDRQQQQQRRFCGRRTQKKRTK